MKTIRTALLLASILIPTAANAQQPALSEEDRIAIAQKVIEHFRQNPEEILRAVGDVELQVQDKRPAAEDYTGAADVPSQGRVEAPFTVIVFSDYGCLPCNEVERTLDGMISERGDIRVVHRDYPMSGEAAVAAALDVISAYNARPRQDWLKMRAVLIEKGVSPEYRIEAMQAAGVEDTANTSAAVKLALLKNREIAIMAGVQSLPAVIVMKGDGVVPISGTVTKADIEQAMHLLDKS